MLQLKCSIPQRLTWPFTPASAATHTPGSYSFAPKIHYLVVILPRIFLLQAQTFKKWEHLKMYKDSLSVKVIYNLSQLLKNCFFVSLKFLFQKAREPDWMHGAKTTVSRYNPNSFGTTQQHGKHTQTAQPASSSLFCFSTTDKKK